MSYDYYRNAGSGWGTNQYQFPAPMRPNFQPQPSWGGQDYFRAHAVSPDLSLYNRAWDRVRDFSGMGPGNEMGMGVGLNEARHWHRRAYGGVGHSQLMPAELGHAAAYEAYRTWIHNSAIYEPLSGDMGRQREGLVGLAIAEATRLLQFTGRSRDGYGRIEACNAAAATASIIFNQSQQMGMDDMDQGYRGRSRSNSFSGYGNASAAGGAGGFAVPSYSPGGMGSSYGGHSPYGGRSPSPYAGTSPYQGGGVGMDPRYGASQDPYAYDDRVMNPRRHKHRHRSRSRSRSKTPAIIIAGGSQGGYGGALPYPGSPMSIPGAGAMVPMSSGYGGGGGSYGSYGAQPMMAGGSYGGVPMPMSAGYGGGYAGSGMAMQQPQIITIPSSNSGSSKNKHGRSRSNSFAGGSQYRY